MNYKDCVTAPLLQWYQENARDLPWRREPLAYHVWLSEIMLQQTRVVAVLEYYHRFLKTLPSISALATCEEEQLMKLWQGLGYYNRARNLQKAAQQIMEQHGGIFPQTYPEILALSGIGEYTAGAIASTVFSLPYPAIDGNVYRVYSRITGDFGDISTKEMKARTRDWVIETMDVSRVGDYNQSLMELGAVVCLPNGEPLCHSCPVSGSCATYGTALWRDLPVKPRKKPRKIEERWVYVLQWGERFALSQREGKGLLAGLWEFPNTLVEESLYHSYLVNPREFGNGRHIFTHIQWEMKGITSAVSSIEGFPPQWKWVTLQEMREVYAIPSAFRWVMEHIQEGTSVP